MNKVVLCGDLTDEQKILTIIHAVKLCEREKGLTDEEISYKYTHGDCLYLAGLIHQFVPRAVMKYMGSGAHSHIFVRMKNPEFLVEGSEFEAEEFFLYDINGKQTADQMEEFIVSELMDDEEKEKYHKSKTPMESGIWTTIDYNETTANLATSVLVAENHNKKSEEETNQKQDKKIYNAEQTKKVLNADYNELVTCYMQLGHPIVETRGKTEDELRQMIFKEVRPEDDVINSITSGSLIQLKHVLKGMGVQKNELLRNREYLTSLFYSIVGEEGVKSAKAKKSSETVKN